MNNNVNDDDFTEKIEKNYYFNTTTKYYYYWLALGFIIYTIFWVWAIRVKLFKSSSNSNSTQVTYNKCVFKLK